MACSWLIELSVRPAGPVPGSGCDLATPFPGGDRRTDRLVSDWSSLYNHQPVATFTGGRMELNWAVAVATATSPEAGLQVMEQPEVTGPLQDYRWYHSARADLLRRLGRFREAGDAYRRAIELTTNASESRFLES
jgi:RNA polymerase sigma-70 factor (ECF subfamily)